MNDQQNLPKPGELYAHNFRNLHDNDSDGDKPFAQGHFTDDSDEDEEFKMADDLDVDGDENYGHSVQLRHQTNHTFMGQKN